MSRQTARAALPSAVGGGVAAALWLLVNGLNTALTFDSTVPASFADLMLPAAIQPVTWVSDVPGNILTPILSALVVGGLVAVAVRLGQRRESRAGSTGTVGLSTLWFATILAAAAVGFALAFGQTIHDWPPARLWNAFDGLAGSVQAAALWGLLWGWLPSALAVRATRSLRRSAPRPGASRLPAALVCAVGIVAVVTSSALTGYTVPTDPSEPAPVVQPTGPAVPPVADGAPAADPQWCSVSQLSLEALASDGAAGHRALGLLATNRSGVDCELDGYPDIAFADANDFLLGLHLVHGGSFATDDSGPTSITLGPGQSATALLGWDAQPRDPEHTVAYLHVAPYPGAERVALPFSGDLVENADVAVTAWAVTGSAPAD